MYSLFQLYAIIQVGLSFILFMGVTHCSIEAERALSIWLFWPLYLLAYSLKYLWLAVLEFISVAKDIFR